MDIQGLKHTFHTRRTSDLRARHGGQTPETHHDRSRRAWLPHRFGLEGLSGDRRRMRRLAACGPAPGRTLARADLHPGRQGRIRRSEEHTSELQSLMRISYAVFCLNKKNSTLLYTTL